MAGCDQAALLETRIALHPAARIATSSPRISAAYGLPDAPFVLISRPEAHILMTAAKLPLTTLCGAITGPVTIEEALTRLADADAEADLFATLTALIEAGAVACIPTFQGDPPC
jgi:hypothetical protein